MKHMVEKNVSCLTAEKKNCLLLIRSENNCTFKLGVEKCFIKKKTIALPHKSIGPPLMKFLKTF